MKNPAIKSKRISVFGFEIFVISALLVTLNISLFKGSATEAFVFVPHKILTGEWWRLILHPFVHVSFYHLLLDGLAFLFLYWTMKDKRILERFGVTGFCAIGSLTAAMYINPEILANGFCGLSGIAHGLMAYYALDMIHERHKHKGAGTIGLAIFMVIAFKSMLELMTGNVVFAFLHFGDVGVPVTACHAGGVAGSIVFYSLVQCLHAPYLKVSRPLFYPRAQHRSRNTL